LKMIKKIRKQFWLAVGLLTGMSATFLLMPLASGLTGQTGGWSIRLLGLAFWALAISGYVTVGRANQNRKKYLHKRFGEDIQKKYRPGVLGVFSNPLAKVIDIMLAVLAVVFVAALFSRIRNTYFTIVIMALVVWAANMHCLFNGRIYRITKKEHKYVKNEHKERGKL